MTIKLNALVIDKESAAGDLLRDSLAALNELILSVRRVKSLTEAESVLAHNSPNLIFIDPMSFGLNEGTKFIFDARNDYPNICFVLYIDFDVIQPKKDTFYAGERKRFKHYHKLNKVTPVTVFRDELIAIVRECQAYVGYKVKASEIRELQSELERIEGESSGGTALVPLEILTEMRDQINLLKERLVSSPSKTQEGTVFLSHRFIEKDYVEGLKTLLEKEGFKVITGENASGYISRSILERIEMSEFFLCLMTVDKEKTDGTYTTSPWLLEEKGAALAMNKKIILMVEEGITDIGGLQGDWQRIHFTAKGFTKAALRAVDQLKTYVG